jgi:hypothetical protein
MQQPVAALDRPQQAFIESAITHGRLLDHERRPHRKAVALARDPRRRPLPALRIRFEEIERHAVAVGDVGAFLGIGARAERRIGCLGEGRGRKADQQ